MRRPYLAGLGSLIALLAVLLLAGVAHAQSDGGPPPATEVSQELSLSTAAAAGIAQLSAKGGSGGDTVAVDLDGATVKGMPVTATVRIEFLGAQRDGSAWPQSKADELAAAITQRLAGSRSSDGTPFRVVVRARVRAGTDPRSGGAFGWHQIVLTDRPAGSESVITNREVGPLGEKSGDWGAHESATTLAHETGHLLGLPDRYRATIPDWIGPDGRRVKLPVFRGNTRDLRALDRWWTRVQRAARALDLRYGRGDIQPAIPEGSENDIMADGSPSENDKPIVASDIDNLIAGAGVRVRSAPGDVLVNKSPDQQNMVVGAGFDLYAPKGGRAHADGLYAYCIDMRKTVPPRDARYDVLGPASALAATYPQFDALAKVAEEVARRQLEPGIGFSGPGGAGDAIWAISDGKPPTTEEGAAILAAVGVTFDAAFFAGSPRLGNPNAASPTTGAVTTDGVVPALPAERGGVVPEPGYPLPAARLSYLRLASTVLRARRPGALTLRSLTDGSAQTYAVAVSRRGGGAVRLPRPVRLPRGTSATLTLRPGPGLDVIRLPRLRAGAYVLSLTGPDGKAKRLAFRAQRRLAPAPRSGSGGRSSRGRTRP